MEKKDLKHESQAQRALLAVQGGAQVAECKGWRFSLGTASGKRDVFADGSSLWLPADSGVHAVDTPARTHHVLAMRGIAFTAGALIL